MENFPLFFHKTPLGIPDHITIKTEVNSDIMSQQTPALIFDI